MNPQNKTTLAKQAQIVETFFATDFDINKTAKIESVSEATVRLYLTKYFAKPEQSMTLQSKV